MKFQKSNWPPSKNFEKNLKKPPGPCGAIFRYFKFFFEKFRRMSVRVLKLHRGFILTKKEILTPQQIWRPPLAPWGSVFSFFLKILEGGQLEFWNFTGGLFSQKKEILTRLGGRFYVFWKFFIENFKSCPRVPKLRIWLLRGWGRCLKVTLQTRELCRWQANIVTTIFVDGRQK